jgi:Domain of unknown function (DUF5122) beta-propeller
MARHNPDGILDPTFGTNGYLTTDLSGDFSDDRANALVMQADGKLVAAGSAHSGGVAAVAHVLAWVHE